MNKIIVLVSGMDSLILFRKIQGENRSAQVIPVWYDLDMPFSKRERAQLPEWVQTRTLSGYASNLASITVDGVEYYNHMFEWMVFDAGRHFNADKVYAGVLASDFGYEDNTLQWVDEFNCRIGRDLLDYPFVREGMSKKDIVEMAIIKGYDLKEAFASNSCRSCLELPNGCGSCWACIRKRGVMIQNGFKTAIPSLLEYPSANVLRQIIKFQNDFINLANVSNEQLKFLGEFLPVLEDELDIHNDLEMIIEALHCNLDLREHKLKEMLGKFYEAR